MLAATAAAAVSPPAARAQTAEPMVGTPLFLELQMLPLVMSGGGDARPGVGVYLAASWLGTAQRGGWRLGLVGSGAARDEVPAAGSSTGVVRLRNTTAVTLERVRRRIDGRRSLTTGWGAGVGNQNADVLRPDGTVAGRDAWAPALSGSVDLGYEFRGEGVVAKPLDLTVGVRVSALVGAPRVPDRPSLAGPLPAPRGVTGIASLVIGVRFGAFSGVFGGR